MSTGATPLELLTGKPPRNPLMDVSGLIRNMPMFNSDTRKQMVKQRQEQKEAMRSKQMMVQNPDRRKVETFQQGDKVYIHTHRPQQQAGNLGVPVKWIYKWDQQGTVLGPVEGHPFQYLVRKDRTGNVVKRSAADLKKQA